jgi:hypothetical protein
MVPYLSPGTLEGGSVNRCFQVEIFLEKLDAENSGGGTDLSPRLVVMRICRSKAGFSLPSF